MIQKVQGKHICWPTPYGDPEITPAFEITTYDKKELSIFKLIWKLLFKRGFKYRLQWVIQYAYRHADCYRGTGSSDVMLLRDNDEYNNFWGK